VTRRALAAVLLACLLAAPVAAALRVKHTRPDTALARASLLRLRDLDKGWQASAQHGSVPALTCGSFNPSLTGVVETGAALSPRFQGDSAGPFASQTAYVYATRAQAATVWTGVARPGLIRCLADTVTRGGSPSGKFEVVGKQRLTLPKLADRAAGYRVVATLTAPGQSSTTVVDLLVVAHGRALTAIGLSSFDEPVPKAAEDRILRRAAERLHRALGQ
jgi:hypothetical protein